MEDVSKYWTEKCESNQFLKFNKILKLNFFNRLKIGISTKNMQSKPHASLGWKMSLLWDFLHWKQSVCAYNADSPKHTNLSERVQQKALSRAQAQKHVGSERWNVVCA